MNTEKKTPDAVKNRPASDFENAENLNEIKDNSYESDEKNNGSENLSENKSDDKTENKTEDKDSLKTGNIPKNIDSKEEKQEIPPEERDSSVSKFKGTKNISQSDKY